MNAGTVEDQKRLVAKAQHAITNGEAGMADAAAKAATAKDRSIASRGARMLLAAWASRWEKVFRANGFSTSDIRHARLLASLPEDAIPKVVETDRKAGERAARRLARKLAAARMVI